MDDFKQIELNYAKTEFNIFSSTQMKHDLNSLSLTITITITITITKILFRQQLRWNVHVKCEK